MKTAADHQVGGGPFSIEKSKKVCFTGQELLGVFFGIGIAGIHHVKGMRFGEAVRGEGADVFILGNH